MILPAGLGAPKLIHEGGDNYSDNPQNGGGKGRVAICGGQGGSSYMQWRDASLRS